MPIQTVCSSCSAKIKVKDELIGKAIKCPKCGERLAVPAIGGGATVALNVAQGALSSESLCTNDQQPMAAAPAMELTGDLGHGARPADRAVAPVADVAGTEFLPTPAAAPAGTEFLSTPAAGPAATEFLSTPDGPAVAARGPRCRRAPEPGWLPHRA